jgi:maleylacetate reductase
MDPFVYNGLPARVIFGVGSLEHLSREIGLLRGKPRPCTVDPAAA